MCEVYHNAVLVIAAAAAASPDTGCLFRSLDHAWRGQVSHHLPTGETLNIYLRKVPFHNFVLWPLSKRAWAFQEQVLGQRVVFLGEVEAWWMCRVDNVCQCGYNELYIPRNKTTSSEDPRKLWKEWVSTYSGLELTMYSDKLPALSGLAKAISSTAPHLGNYLAGLWQGDLHYGLGWSVVNPAGVGDPRVPSWSWAKTNSHVYFQPQTHDGDTRVKILEAQCVLKSVDPFGEVTSGFILVLSALVPVNLFARSCANANGDGNDRLEDFLIRALDIKLPRKKYHRAHMDYWWTNSSQWVVERGDENLENAVEVIGRSTREILRNVSTFYALLLFRGFHNRDYLYLILKAVPGRIATYERIGCVFMDSICFEDDSCEAVLKII